MAREPAADVTARVVAGAVRARGATDVAAARDAAADVTEPVAICLRRAAKFVRGPVREKQAMRMNP